MEYLNRIKSTVSSVAFTAAANINTALPGNPVTREYEAICQIGSAGPGLSWKIFSAQKRSTKQKVAVWLFVKKDIEKWPKREKDMFCDLVKRGVSQLTRLRHPRLLIVEHGLEESRQGRAWTWIEQRQDLHLPCRRSRESPNLLHLQLIAVESFCHRRWRSKSKETYLGCRSSCIYQKIVGLSDTVSRHNCPAQPFSIAKHIRSLQGESRDLSIVLVAEPSHIYASVCAIAKAFPLYSRKTETKEGQPLAVSIELLAAHATSEGVSADDVACAQTAVDAVRLAARLVDAPANELTTDALVDEARRVADTLTAGGSTVDTVVIRGEQLKVESGVVRAAGPADDVACAQMAVDAVCLAARLVDAPANELTTDALVDEARRVANTLTAGGSTVDTVVIRGEQLKEAGFGGVYHVGKAAVLPPAVVILSWKPPTETDETEKQVYTLVGKGIVFDTGGMQIKMKTMMPNMKRDMGGAAGVLAGFYSLVKAGFSHTLHCVLCIAENMIGPLANRPDDIIRMLSGKSVEINNTDAEGRLVLADGVYYAVHTLKSNVVIDMATLTGAQAHATGKLHAAILTNNEEWETKALQAGRFGGDLVHALPFSPELHFGDLASSLADMKNSNLGKMQGPPSAVAALFIHANACLPSDGSVVWLHVDMAAPAESGERATGYGPALLAPLLMQHDRTQSTTARLLMTPN